MFKIAPRTDYQGLSRDAYAVYDFDRSREVKEVVRLIKGYFREIAGLTVLEIGCGTGVLLDGLSQYGMRVYGFEPSPVAAKMAREKYGLQTVRNSYFLSSKLTVSPDVFLLYDVLEHLESPLELLWEIRDAMSTRSVLIIKSGDPNSFNALLFPPRWIYFLLDQHISFFPEEALQLLSEKAGLVLDRYLPFRHAYGGYALSKLLRNIAKSFLFHILPESGAFHKRYAIDLANDHFIAVIRRPA